MSRASLTGGARGRALREPTWDRGDLEAAFADARRRTLALVEDLTDAQLIGPRLEIVNPLLWEIGHVAWFQERWVLRELHRRRPVLENGDDLYNSAEVAHDTRWDLFLPSRRDTLAYMRRIHEDVLEVLSREPEGPLPPERLEYYLLALFHEDMHDEAFTYTRQTLAYPAPPFCASPPEVSSEDDSGAEPDDVEIPGGRYEIGAPRSLRFSFDNERWAHEVEVAPFRMSRRATTQGAFLAFVEDGGYERRELWSDEGWRWREREGAAAPVYWRRAAPGCWERRVFDRWVPLEPSLPVIHVNAYEAEAWCRWAGRRLPTEAEWEWAASFVPGAESPLPAEAKRAYPWGDDPPDEARANLDGTAGGPISAGALPDGASAHGVRQLLGNVWEWTASPFGPYPGFAPGLYREYSAPWFGDHRVLRGGCWVTRGRMIRNLYRNYYTPDRRDVWAGFRTCADDEGPARP